MQDSNENDSSEENRGNDHSEEENNHKTNLLLVTLLKKIDHQNQRISELTESYAAASKASTPTRKSTSCSRQKEVPLQVRVSLSSYTSSIRGAITCSLFAPYQRETRRIYAMLIEEDANFTGWKIGDGLVIAIYI